MEVLKRLLEDQARAFEEFKTANNERLASIEARGAAPAELDAKLARINDELARLEENIKAVTLTTQRPASGADDSEQMRAYKDAMFGKGGFMRTGRDEALLQIQNTMRSGSDPDGGFLLPGPTVGAINRVAEDDVAMYDLATVTDIDSPNWEEPVVTAGMTRGHTGETGTRSASTTPTIAKITITPGESYVMPPCYNHMLQDAAFDLEAWLIQEAGMAFADGDDEDFITGTGVNSARGIAGYTFIADSSYAWGKVGYIASGKSGAFADTNPADKIIDLETALKTKYRSRATYLMSRTTLGAIRKLQDGMGNYLWQPGLQAGIPNSINGIPYRLSDNMAAIASNSYSIALADFMSAYRIVRRTGMIIIRDNVTTKGLTYFYISKRVGGGIKNFEAIKFMKFAAS